MPPIIMGVLAVADHTLQATIGKHDLALGLLSTPEVSDGDCIVVLQHLDCHCGPQVLRLVHRTKLTLTDL